MSIFTERIDNLLKEKKKTKKELFNHIGISSQSFYDWKNRNTIPAADIAVKIAQYLNTTVEYLITGNKSNPLIDENKELKNKIDKAINILQ